MGMNIERRSFLGLAGASILAHRGPRPVIPRPQDEPELTLEEFLEDVLPVARELRAALTARPPRTPEDRYLHTLASYAVRLGDVPLPERMNPTSQGEGVEIGANWAGDPFVVLHWNMSPGSTVRVHAHTYGNVCTVGLEGVARIRNYETVEPLDTSVTEPVLIRQTTDQRLDAGGIDLVPLSHGFCHGFVAGPEGARGLDITTRLAPRLPTAYLELEDEPADRERGLLRGRWELVD